MYCLDSETIERLISGELSAQMQNEVTVHLDKCVRCRHLTNAKRSEEELFHRIVSAYRSNESELSTASIQDVIESTKEYTVESLCGRGGQGLVFKAIHNKLKRAVAIKVLGKGRQHDRHAINRFTKEMEAIGALDHPNIIRAYDAREVQGVLLLAMEFVPGSDLGNWVDEKGPFSISTACELVRQAAIGLQHAHESGVVHGDVKPRNLLLSNDGTVKILDLGLVRFHGSPNSVESIERIDFDSNGIQQIKRTGDEEPVTHERTIVAGTPDYMAPELWEGGPLNPSTDIYALGCTLFQLLTGKAPFDDGDGLRIQAKMIRHTKSDVPHLQNCRSDVPDSLVDIVYKMMAKQPQDRYASAMEVAECLKPHCTSISSTNSDRQPSGVHKKRSGVRVVMSILAFLVLAIGAYLFVTSIQPRELVFGGFDRNRGGLMSLKYGQGLVQLRNELEQKMPAARLVETNKLTPEFLSNIDVLFISSARDQHESIKLTEKEQVALLEYVKKGGGAIILIDNDSFGDQDTDVANESFINTFGVNAEGGLGGYQTIDLDSSHQLVDGRFGKAERLKVLFPGYFSQLGKHAVGLGKFVEPTKGSPIAIIDRGKLSPKSGRVVIIADTGPFIDVENLFGQNDNGKFALNAFAWVLPDGGSERATLPADFEGISKIDMDPGQDEYNQQ